MLLPYFSSDAIRPTKKQNQKHLIIGAGETGTALKKVLSPYYDIVIRDIKNAIPVGFALLALMLPLFFGTWSTEYFDFNKSILFITGTAVLFTLWLLRLTLEGRIRFRKTVLDIPLLILLLVLFGSSFFGVNRLLSFTRIEFWLWLCAIWLTALFRWDCLNWLWK